MGEAISERLKVKSSSFAKTPISPINSSQQRQTKRECDAGANIPKKGKRQERDQTLGKTGDTDFERAFLQYMVRQNIGPWVGMRKTLRQRGLARRAWCYRSARPR